MLTKVGGGVALLGVVSLFGLSALCLRRGGGKGGGKGGGDATRAIASAADEEEDEEDEEEEGGLHEPNGVLGTPPQRQGGGGGLTALVLSGSGGRGGGSKPIKTYVELDGDVHTLRVKLDEPPAGGGGGGGGSAMVLVRKAVAEACESSGAPELQGIDLGRARIQYLNASDAPDMVTESTSLAMLGGARAFRVIFD